MKRTLGLTLLLFATLFSCMRQEKPLPAELSSAESVMWEHPDSALSILRSMPQSSLSSGKNYATWALLLAQARDKVYGKRLPDSLNIPSSDKLVQDAMDYFEKEGDLKRMAQTYYYKGQLLKDQKKITEAMPFFLKSKEMMTKLDEPLFTYLICQSLGNMYRYQDLYEESLVQLKDAYQYALRSGNGERISYALSELGRTYVHKNEMDSALFYFGKSLDNAQRLGNIELEAMAMGELGVVYNKLSQGEKALHYTRKELDLCLQISSLHKLPQVYYKIGSAFWSLGQLDSAKVYFQKSLETDNLYTLNEAYEVLYYICVEQKLYKEAIEYNNQYLIYSDSLQVINHAGELAEIQARYDHERLLNINNQLKLEKTNQEIIGLFVTAVLLILIIVYQYRVLRKEKSLAHAREQIRIYKESIKENENRIKENEQLMATLNNKQQEIDEIVSENKSLLDQNAESHKEIEKYEELLKSSYKKLDEQLPYFDKLKDLKEHPRYLKDADWSLIINWTNLQYHQFYTRLEKDFPDFSELDKRYCCLIKMGFSSSQIAVFANSLPESVSKQKQRIKQRIKKSKQIPSDVSFLLDQYLKEY